MGGKILAIDFVGTESRSAVKCFKLLVNCFIILLSLYYLNNHHCCKLMAFPYPGFTREMRKAEETICWEVGEREATWSYS